MHLRRTIALATGALALSALTSCGFDYATDREYTPANGVNNRDTSVDILNAVVVSAEEGSGTFIASFSNNDEDNPATFDGLQSTETDELTIDQFEPIEIPAAGMVNLADEGGVGVSGDFAAGDFIEMLVLVNGEQVEMDVHVITNCGDFEGLDGPSDPEQCEPETEEPAEH